MKKETFPNAKFNSNYLCKNPNCVTQIESVDNIPNSYYFLYLNPGHTETLALKTPLLTKADLYANHTGVHASIYWPDLLKRKTFRNPEYQKVLFCLISGQLEQENLKSGLLLLLECKESDRAEIFQNLRLKFTRMTAVNNFLVRLEEKSIRIPSPYKEELHAFFGNPTQTNSHSSAQ